MKKFLGLGGDEKAQKETKVTVANDGTGASSASGNTVMHSATNSSVLLTSNTPDFMDGDLIDGPSNIHISSTNLLTPKAAATPVAPTTPKKNGTSSTSFFGSFFSGNSSSASTPSPAKRVATPKNLDNSSGFFNLFGGKSNSLVTASTVQANAMVSPAVSTTTIEVPKEVEVADEAIKESMDAKNATVTESANHQSDLAKTPATTITPVPSSEKQVKKRAQPKAAISATSASTPAKPVVVVNNTPASIQTFKDAFDYAATMPDCAEKYLVQLVSHFQERNKKKSEQGFMSAEQVSEAYQSLKQRLAVEELAASSVNRAINVLDHDISGDKFQKLAETFLRVLREIQPLDMPLLMELIDKAKSASGKIQEQDVLVFLGNTGVGKSTTLLFCADQKLQKTKVGGIFHIGPVNTLAGELTTVKTSASTRSETRHLNPISIRYKVTESNERDLILCDTPGFGDTEGSVVDIANSIGLVKALQKSKSTKLVVLISEKSLGDRWQALTELARTLVRFVDNIEGNLDKISYVFTKFTSQDDNADSIPEEINALLKDKLENLIDTEKSDLALVAILNDMISKTEDKKAIVLNPLQANREDFLNRITSVSAVTEPQNVFRNFVNSKAIADLSNQLAKLENSIKSALGRSDFELLNYKLEQLKTLSDELQLTECNDTYARCTSELANYISGMMSNSEKILNEGLKDDVDLSNQIRNCYEKITILRKLNGVQRKHLTRYSEMSDSVIFSKNMIVQAQKYLLGKVKENSFGSLNTTLLVGQIQKMMLMLSTFGDFKYNNTNDSLSGILENAKTHFGEIFNTILRTVAKSINENNPKDYVKNMMDASSLIQDSLKELGTDSGNKKIEKAKEYAFNHFSKILKTSYETLNIENISLESVSQTLIAMDAVNGALTEPGIDKYLDVNKLNQERERFIFSCKDYFASVREKVSSLFYEDRDGALEFVKNHIGLIIELRKNSEVNLGTNAEFDAVLDVIRNFLANIKANVLKTVGSLEKTPENMEDFHRNILKDLVFIQKARQTLPTEILGSQYNALSELSKSVESYANILSDELSAVSEAQASQLIFLNFRMEQINSLGKICSIILPSIKTIVHKANSKFSSTIIEKLSRYETVFQENIAEDDLDLTVFEESLLYLTACSEIKSDEISGKSKSVSDVEREYFNNYFNSLDQKIKHAVSNIESILSNPTLDAVSTFQAANDAAEVIVCGLKKCKEFLDRYQAVTKRDGRVNLLYGIFREIFLERTQEIMDFYCKEDVGQQGKLLMFLDKFSELAKLQEEVSDEKSKTDMAELQSCMIVARALSPIDDILNTKIKYSVLNARLENALRSFSSDIKTQIVLALYRFDFEEILAQMKVLEDSGESAQIEAAKKVLIAAVRKTVESLSDDAVEKVFSEEILDKLSKVDLGLNKISKYLEGSKEEFVGVLKNTGEVLLGKITASMNRVEKLIEENNFIEAENVLGIAQCFLVKYYSSEKNNALKKNFNKNFDGFREKIRIALEELKSIYVDENIDVTGIQVYNPEELIHDDLNNYYVLALDGISSATDSDETLDLESEESAPTPVPEFRVSGIFYVNKEINFWTKIIVEVSKLEFLGRLIKEKLEDESSSLGFSDVKDYLNDSPFSLDFSSLISHPLSKLFENLNRVKDRDEFYSKTMDDISNFVLEQIELFLVKITISDPEVAKAQLKYIASLERYFPEDLASKINKKLLSTERHVVAEQQQYENKIREINTDVRKLIEVMNENQNKWYFSRSREVKLLIDRLIKQRIMEVSSKLMNGLSVSIDALESLSGFFSDVSFYVGHLDDSRRIYPGNEDDYEDLSSLPMKNSILSILAVLRKSLGNIKEFCQGRKIDVSTVIQSFELVKAFYRVKEKNEVFFEHMESLVYGSIYSELDDILKDILNYFSENKMGFDENLKKGRASKAMDFIQDSEPLRNSVLSFFSERLNDKKFNNLNSDLVKIESYRDVKRIFSAAVLSWANGILRQKDFLENEELMSDDSTERDRFYSSLNRNYVQLDSAREGSLRKHIDASVVNVDEMLFSCLNKIQHDIKSIFDNANNLLELIENGNEDTHDSFNKAYDALRACRDNFKEKSIQNDAGSKIEILKAALLRRLSVMKEDISSRTDIGEIAKELVRLKSMAMKIPQFKGDVDKAINEILEGFEKKTTGTSIITKIAIALNGYDDPLSKIVISEHSAFKGYALSLRNQKMSRVGIEDILKDLKGDDLDKSLLRREYAYFDENYWRIVDKVLQEFSNRIPAALDQIVADAKIIANKTDIGYVEKVRQLMVYLFSHWTLQSSKHYIENLNTTTVNDESRKNYLMQPHSAQIVTIFRLLGFDKGAGLFSVFSDAKAEDHETILARFLDNHLDQMLSGQGKSVTLAVIAAVLAMLGFNISEACYSKYLSDRDYNDFKVLFNAFGLSKNIHYGTFTDVCERIINKDGDIREIVLAMIRGEDLTPLIKKNGYEAPWILLADEADVFFKQGFYGSAYNPVASLKDPTISHLIRYIWKNRKDSAALKFNAIKKTQEYQACIDRFMDFDDLIKNCVINVLNEIKGIDEKGPEYVVVNGRIAYKENDGLSSDINYGYRTLFDYFKENEKGSVTDDILEGQIALSINCGSFSYAEIAKKYVRILGATGTLEILTNLQRKILKEEFRIGKNTYTPSVYGNRLQFRGNSIEDVVIIDSDSEMEYRTALKNQIQTRLAEKTGAFTRAVMVFFETKEELYTFYNSVEFSSLKSATRVMTEETSPEDKSVLVSQAATTGRVTLMTSELTRGLDTICHDDALNAAGGPHVAFTYVPEDPSEEEQGSRRVDRLGEGGSKSLVLSPKKLAKFGITSADIKEMKNTGKLHSTIDEKRGPYFESKFNETIEQEKKIKKQHTESMGFRNNVVTGNRDAVRDHLLKYNPAAVVASKEPSRTLILLDATGSMKELLNGTKAKISVVFERVNQILKENKFDSPFEVQIVAYRNYNSVAELEEVARESENSRDHSFANILRYSGWQTDPTQLQDFMKTVHAQGGGGYDSFREAIEVALQYANGLAEKSKITQVILLGDVGAFISKNRVKYVRNAYNWDSLLNSTPWQKNRHLNLGKGSHFDLGKVTYYKDEIALLKEKGIPVQAFYLDRSAREDFEEMARETNGNSGYLNIHNATAHENLTNIVAQRILASIGGDDLVEAYQARFITKGYNAPSAVRPSAPMLS